MTLRFQTNECCRNYDSIDFAHRVAGEIILTVQLTVGHETKTAEKSQRS